MLADLLRFAHVEGNPVKVGVRQHQVFSLVKKSEAHLRLTAQHGLRLQCFRVWWCCFPVKFCFCGNDTANWGKHQCLLLSGFIWSYSLDVWTRCRVLTTSTWSSHAVLCFYCTETPLDGFVFTLGFSPHVHTRDSTVARWMAPRCWPPTSLSIALSLIKFPLPHNLLDIQPPTQPCLSIAVIAVTHRSVGYPALFSRPFCPSLAWSSASVLE